MTVAGRTTIKAALQSGQVAFRGPQVLHHRKSDPKQPVGPPNGGLRATAPKTASYVSQRELLKQQGVMSARENDQQSNEMDELRDYGLAYVVRLICLRPR